MLIHSENVFYLMLKKIEATNLWGTQEKQWKNTTAPFRILFETLSNVFTAKKKKLAYVVYYHQSYWRAE